MGNALIGAGQLAGMQATVNANFDTPAVRRRFPLVADRYSNQVRDTAHPQDVNITAIGLHQAIPGAEDRIGRDEQISDWIGRFPSGTDITGRDQIIAAGKTFEVIGPPDDFATHIHAHLRYIEG